MRLFLPMIMVLCLALPVSATEFTAPAVPDSGVEFMPEDTASFGDALLEILRNAVSFLRPDIREAAGLCLGLCGIVLLVSLVQTFPGTTSKITDLVGIVAIGSLLLQRTNALVHLGVDTIDEISNYGKLLLPVLTAALAAQGGVTGSAVLYSGTVLFDSILGHLIARMITPMIYLFLALAAGNGAVGEDVLKKFRDSIKWLMTWCLKIVLYVFTGYMGITGVVSGTTDAAALKAAKLTISGVVPVVGGILSDASEAVLVSAGIVKNSAGIYGLLAIISVCIGPFLRIGSHYLMLKITGAVCGIYGSKSIADFIGDFSTAMGLLLGMTGSVCLLLLISTVCFLRGVSG